jgi:hypothetical protein
MSGINVSFEGRFDRGVGVNGDSFAVGVGLVWKEFGSGDWEVLAEGGLGSDGVAGSEVGSSLARRGGSRGGE